MSKARLWLGAVAVLGMGALFLSAGGCDSGSGLAPIAVTTGQVTLDGKPLPSGEIGFVADVDKGTDGPTGIGEIDKDGRYRIVTARKDGALVGHHKVRILADDPTKPGRPWITPEKYNDPNTSGLTAEVKAGQDNVINFELKSNP